MGVVWMMLVLQLHAPLPLHEGPYRPQAVFIPMQTYRVPERRGGTKPKKLRHGGLR